jgi:type II secretory pathway pseudopilin PulG
MFSQAFRTYKKGACRGDAASAGGESSLSRSRNATGFSLLELMIVIGISVTLAAIAVPSFLNAYYSLRLKSAASDLAGFMQRCRITAARANTTYAIGYRTVTGAQEAFIDLNLNGTYDPGEPILTFSPSVTPAAGAPTGGGGTPPPYVLVGDTAGTTFDNTTTLAYSSRGLPCAYVLGVCATPAPGYFVYYLQDQRPTTVGWAGVVVTRSGRTKAIVWNGVAWQ